MTFLDLIEVRYRGDDPDLGTKLVACLSENYMRNTRDRISQILTQSKDFFSNETKKRAELAVQKEAELLHMSVTYPGISPADPDLLSQRLIAVNLAVEETTSRRSETQSKIDSLTEYLQSLKQPGATVQPSSGMSDVRKNPQKMHLQQEMDRVKAQIADAKALQQMTDNHPHVLGLREKLEQLRIASEQLPDTVAASSITSAGTDAGQADPTIHEQRRVQSELNALKETLTRADADLVKRKAEKAQLEEDKGMLFERRQNYLRRQEELQNIKADLRIWEGHVDTVSRVLTAEEGKRGIGFATVEAARRPRKPISPTIGGVFLLSAGIGLALGAAAVFLREVLDRSLRDPTKIRQSLGIPVLETIGEIRVGPKPNWLDRRMLLPAVAGVETIALAMISFVVFASLRQPELYDRFLAGKIPTGWLSALFGA